MERQGVSVKGCQEHPDRRASSRRSNQAVIETRAPAKRGDLGCGRLEHVARRIRRTAYWFLRSFTLDPGLVGAFLARSSGLQATRRV